MTNSSNSMVYNEKKNRKSMDLVARHYWSLYHDIRLEFKEYEDVDMALKLDYTVFLFSKAPFWKVQENNSDCTDCIDCFFFM
jgi:predicted aldo/keto reductase-like oxidoreductase